VHVQSVVGPAVHAIVIGAGDYPHLVGGAGPLFPQGEGMGQLTSAPVSARAFADWLVTEYHNPGRPLASVRLLLSEPAPAVWKHPVTQGEQEVPRADMASVKVAIQQGWLPDLDTSEDHLGIFYYCGHGVTAGMKEALLLSDFGGNPVDPYDAALRFDGFEFGMNRAKAREQLYIVDACRTPSPAFLNTHEFGGHALVTGQAFTGHSRGRRDPVLRSTSLGAAAFGRPGQPSLFTQALLAGLRGAGSDNADDEQVWQVGSNMLGEALQFLVKRTLELEGLTEEQIPVGPSAGKVIVSILKAPPKVPVIVTCDPHEVTQEAEFSCGDLPKWNSRNGDPFVPVGAQTFTAEVAGPPVRRGSRAREVRPPYVRVQIPVTEADQ
jgi:hypothetical protein